MQFIYPYFLWGLTAVAIPLVIHLFRLRRFKTIFFSDTRLLRDVQIETRKKSKIKHLIILILRMLAIAALVIAFARPFLPLSKMSSEGNSYNTVAIFIDNSFSMDAGEEYYSRLNEAKKIALQITDGFSVSDKFILLTNKPDAESFRLMTKKQMVQKIQEIQISSYTSDLENIFIRFSELTSIFPGEKISSFVISDFQETFVNPETIVSNVDFPVFLVPIQGVSVMNAGVDSVWLDSPVLQKGAQAMVAARIVNYSDKPYQNLPVELYVNGSRRSVAGCDISPGGFAFVEMSFVPSESGILNCYVKIDDSPVAYDNVYYFSINISEQINVMAVSGKERLNRSIGAVFGNEPLFNFYHSPVSNLQYDRIANTELLVLDAVENPPGALIQEVNSFVRNGGSLLIVPPPAEKLIELNGLMRSLGLEVYGNQVTAGLRVSGLNTSHELFRGVFDGVPKDMDLPMVKRYFQMTEAGVNPKQALMKLQNEAPLLVMASVEKGFVYYFTVPFQQEFTDLHQHAIVVPVLYQMAFLSNRQSNLQYTIGSNEAVVFASKEIQEGTPGNVKVANLDKSLNFIPGIKFSGNRVMLFLHGMIDEADNYEVMYDNLPLHGFSMNYSRNESVMNFYTSQDLDSLIREKKLKDVDILQAYEGISSDIQALMHGKQLWKIFLLMALFFLAIEVILLRFWK